MVTFTYTTVIIQYYEVYLITIGENTMIEHIIVFSINLLIV